MVTLINREKRMQVFNLPAPADVEDTLSKTIEQRTIEEYEEGKKGVKVTEHRVPGSLTLLVGEKKVGLPDWVKTCPEVKAALDRGAIKLIQE